MYLPIPLQVGDPSALFGLSGPVLSALSFVSVLAVGVVLLRWRGPLVDRAVDRVVDGSPVAVVYGFMAFGLVAFAAGYLTTQVPTFAPAPGPVRTAGSLLSAVALVALAGFGYLVLGTYLTQLEGGRRPWPGVVVGAALSAVPWTVLPTLPALAVWVAVSAVGLGSPTRHWVHDTRTAERERQRGD
jgi:hypothetical protein